MDFLKDQLVEQVTALKGLWKNKRQVGIPAKSNAYSKLWPRKTDGWKTKQSLVSRFVAAFFFGAQLSYDSVFRFDDVERPYGSNKKRKSRRGRTKVRACSGRV